MITPTRTAFDRHEQDSEPLLQMLAAFGPKFSEIAREYQASLPQRLAAMRDAAAMGAHEILAVAAHRLAGGSASLGATEVTALCRALETSCTRDGQVPSDYAERLAAITLACSAFNARLEALEQALEQAQARPN